MGKRQSWQFAQLRSGAIRRLLGNAMERLYPTSPAARKKGARVEHFWGLCEEGLVKGIPAGRYAASRDNKAYAVRAAAC